MKSYTPSPSPAPTLSPPPSPPPAGALLTAADGASPGFEVWTQQEVAAFLKVDVRTVTRLDVPTVPVYVDPDKRPMPRYDSRDVHAWWDERRQQARSGGRPTRSRETGTARRRRPSLRLREEG